MTDRSGGVDLAIHAVIATDRRAFDAAMDWPIDDSSAGVPLFLRAAYVRCWAEDRFETGFASAAQQAVLALRHYEVDLGSPAVESLGISDAEANERRGDLAGLYAYRLFSESRSEKERIDDGQTAARLRAAQFAEDLERGDDPAPTAAQIRWLFWALGQRTFSGAALGLVRDAALDEVRGQVEDAVWQVVDETVSAAATATIEAISIAATEITGLLQ